MEKFATTLCLMVTICFWLIMNCIGSRVPGEFDVVDYGAVGDGKTYDTEAFLKAWKEACSCSTSAKPTMVIPRGKTFLVRNMTFTGPCMSYTYVKLAGAILAPDGPGEWKGRGDLLAFNDVNGLTVNGKGTIDGRGKIWWERVTGGWKDGRPTILVFQNCTAVQVDHIHIRNSPQTHILVWNSKDVNLTLVGFDSPEDSPNTDGIHIEASSNIRLHVLLIKSGDDCISIGDHTSNVNISDILCGPGHGISVGSLGRWGRSNNFMSRVENITVHRAHFFGTQNGVRIKTYETGKGLVQGVRFANLTFKAVQNPIIIDQHYCFDPKGCQEYDSAIQIRDVHYSGAVGTSTTASAINLNCSTPTPCKNIYLENIRLTAADPKNKVVSSCRNAQGINIGFVEPKSCF